MARLAELSDLVEATLKLSKVKAGERVVLVTTHDFKEDEVAAYRIALNRLDADFFWAVIPPREGIGPHEQLFDPGGPFFYDVLKSADMVVMAWSSSRGPFPTSHSPNVVQALEAGTRGLLVQLALSLVRQMFPDDELIRRTFSGAKVMQEASKIRVTSSAGTDLVMSKAGRPGHCQCGVTDVPGRWDNASFGCVACAPLEDSANGTLVLQPGDAISQLKSFVTEPVRLTIREGRIVNIQGEATAARLRRWFAQWNDDESYGISHIGWGTHPRTGTGEGSYDHLLAYLHNAYGSMLIAFGDNIRSSTAPYSGLDGRRRALSHIDIGVFDVTFELDGEVICQGGQIVHPAC